MTAPKKPSQEAQPATPPPLSATGDYLKVRPAGQIPESFGRYRIVKVLGQGGMGTVYLAHDTQLKRDVALKVPRLAPDDAGTLRERFLREARSAATLHHPNICTVFDVGEVDGVLYVTMALVEGKSLADVLQSGKPMPQRPSAQLIRKLAQAMQTAHDKGVVHRDLKPANVMLSGKNQPVIMDFGLALHASEDNQRLTGEGVILGTPAYMAPEQVNGDLKSIGPACDIYSLGVILYQMLTGRTPFSGPTIHLLVQIATESPRRPSELRADLEPALEAICLKAMARSIGDRYRSMADLAAALGGYLEVKPAPPLTPAAGPPAVPAKPAPSTQTAPASADDGSTTGVLANLVPRLPGFRLGFWSAVLGSGIVVVALVALLVVLFLRTPEGGSSGGTTVQIGGIFQVHNEVNFILDGKPISRQELEKPRSLKPGEHTLTLRKPDGTEEVRKFIVKPEAGAQQVVVPAVAEGEGSPGEILCFTKHTTPTYSVAFSPDGSRIASAEYGSVRTGHFPGQVLIWDPKTGDETQPALKYSCIREITFSPDGKRLFMGSFGTRLGLARVVVWDLDKRLDLRVIETHSLPSATSSAVAGNRVLVSDENSSKENQVYDGDIEAPLVKLPYAKSGCLTVDGTRVIQAEGLELCVYSVPGGSKIQTMKGHTDPIAWMARSPDGRYLVTGSGGPSNTLRLWDLRDGKVMRGFSGHTAPVNCVAFSPDSSRILSASDDGSARLWNAETGEETYCFRGHKGPVSCVAFSPGGRLAASGGDDKTVRIWRLP